MPEEALRRGSATIDDAAVAAGRDPRSIRRILNISGRLTDGATRDGPLDGPPERWIERLLGWVDEARADTFVFWPSSTDVVEIERFGREVVPGVRDALGARRR
jgi:alkanesulfonate monooxygenase SsuD/methylene tetrahydromethanopterin reductase-like flavin-dependent oxidoreductase (luciferase family)